MNLDGSEEAGLPDELALEDKWVLTLYNDLVKEVTDNLERFELGIAVQKLYDFIWDVFCDWYIELAKIRLQTGRRARTVRKARAHICHVQRPEAPPSVHAVRDRGDLAVPAA